MKKLVPLTLAFVLATSLSVPTFADTSTETSATGEETTVTGDGGVTYVNTVVYKVVVPTSAAFNFQIDPQGLLGITDGSHADLSSLTGGAIVSGQPVPFINKSSVPVKLTAKVTGTGDGTFLDDDTALTADTDPNVLMYVAPSTADMEKSDTTFAPTTDGFVVKDDAATEFNFALPAADYVVNNTGGEYTVTLKDATKGHGNALRIGGLVNSKADWSDFTGASPDKTVGVSVVFTYEKDDATHDLGDFDATAYSLLDMGLAPTFAATFPAPAVTAPTITIDTQPATSTNVTVGSISGSLTVATSVTQSGTATYQWYSDTDTTVGGGSIIGGATSASFAIPTDLTAGTHYYYCVVSATGATAVNSTMATVVVAAPAAPFSGAVVGFLNTAQTANVSTPTYTTSKASATDLVMPFYLGSKTIASIKWGSGTEQPANKIVYNSTAYTLSLKKDNASTDPLRTGSIGTKAVTITFADQSTMTFTINLTA